MVGMQMGEQDGVDAFRRSADGAKSASASAPRSSAAPAQ